ncbi:MAG TPA: MFS transporter [Solirubrobacter sp.]|nr:MFS transporter [Solirubrobacter sp.]
MLARLRAHVGLVVLCGCLISLITLGVRAGLGLFTDPLTEARGWDREVFALAMAIQNLLWGLGQPFAGGIADRYGAGRVLTAGAAIYAAGMALMAASATPGALYVTGGLLIGLGMSGASFTIVIAAFSRLVPIDRRSWAIGLATACGSLGQFVFAPVGQAFIAAYDWQVALVLLAGFVTLVPALAVALGGAPAVRDDSPAVPVASALRRAFGHGSYLLLAGGFFVCGFHVAFILVHLPPYVADLGLPASTAALALGIVGLGNMIGSYLAGVITARHSPRLLLAGIYSGRAVVITAFLLTPPSVASVLVFAAAMGLLWLSTVPPTSALVGLFFGVRNMGTLFGFVFLSHQVGAFAGVWLGGVIESATGSYDPVWWIGVALGVTAAILHLPIRERRAPALAPA